MEPVKQMNGNQDLGRHALAEALRLSLRLLLWAMALIMVAYLFSGWFVVQEHQRAYVLVFGKVSGVGAERLKGPGLHLTWPRPIAEVVYVPAERIQSIEVNTHWFELHPESQWDMRRRDVGPSLRPGRDGYLLTSDSNILHARWGLRFTIRDPEAFLFRFADPEAFLRKELDRAATRIGHRWTVDDALRLDIEGFRSEVALELQQRLHEQSSGIQLHRLDLLAIAPPQQVSTAFESVIEAEQDRSRAISAARAYAARSVNEAKGDASKILSDAHATRQRIISGAEADAQYFQSVMSAFREQPELTLFVLWQDRMRVILQRVESQLLLRQRTDGRQEIRLHIAPPSNR